MSAKKVVVKFGGSNLKQNGDIAKLIRVIKLYKQPIIIVVSALYGVTDSLVNTLGKVKSDENAISDIKTNLLEVHRQIVDFYVETPGIREDTLYRVDRRVQELEKYLRGVNCLGEIPDFVEDLVLSYGERLSSLVLSAILNDKNILCRECLPEDLGLYTNGEYRNAAVDFSLSEEKVKHSLSGDDIYIIPGFYGISTDAKVTLLGRGGSDYTAAAVACCIDAASLDLWKDVPGFMSADPKLVENPLVIQRLTYNEAAELCYFGARIAHPRTFEPVAEKKIPVRLFNINDFSDELNPVTVVENKGEIKKDVIKSITFSDDFGVLKMHGAGVGIKPGIMAKVTTRLNDEGINIKSIITSQTCINILLSGRDLAKGLQTVESTGLSVVDRITAIDDISVIAVVGEGILEAPGIAARIFGAVSRHHINIRTISAGASDAAIYFIIGRQENVKAVKSIHDEFFISRYLNTNIPFNQEYEAELGYII